MNSDSGKFDLSKSECQKLLSSYLSDEEYINQNNSLDNPLSLIHAISVVARARGMSKLARNTGISRDGLYKAFSRHGNPSFGTVVRVLSGLGYSLKICLKK